VDRDRERGRGELELYTERPRRSRRGLVLSLAAGATGLVLLIVGVLVVMALTSQSKDTDFAVGKCVKQNGSTTKAVSCSDSGAYKIVEKVEHQDRCPDVTQPYVELSRGGGKTEVLCLRPAATK
jgi:hypothetical protein